MKIRWVEDYEENQYWDLMQEPKRPKPTREFNLHGLCIANAKCVCGKERTKQTERIEEARKRKYAVDCE